MIEEAKLLVFYSYASQGGPRNEEPHELLQQIQKINGEDERKSERQFKPPQYLMPSSRGTYEEHHLSRIVPGDLETVRNRICGVLEKFNYVVLGENRLTRFEKPRQSLISKTPIV